jgi:hypothetical protein
LSYVEVFDNNKKSVFKSTTVQSTEPVFTLDIASNTWTGSTTMEPMTATTTMAPSQYEFSSINMISASTMAPTATTTMALNNSR